MIFADLFFLYIFIPLLAVFYISAYCIDRIKIKKSGGEITVSNNMQNIVLVIFSLIFYAWGEPLYILLMLSSITINFYIGKAIDISSDKKSKGALILGVAVNILFIAVFKYMGFFVRTINAFGLKIPEPSIALPIGISFYTFQAISYIADVYRGTIRAQKKYRNLLLYIAMFPQLIAGPIVRYTTVENEIENRQITSSDLSEGIFRFLIGLGKKVLLANQFASISTAILDSNIADISLCGSWIGLIAFALQIYFDFSGYSDMAIGMGRCLGFHFDENFNYPYISQSITEFWRRWHISLGSLFRDYVYIPMGGNRKHQFINILVVWFLTGMWHGASWNFIIWGLYFGAIILIEKYLKFKPSNNPFKRFFKHTYSLFLIVFGWAIFYFNDFGNLGRFIQTLFGFGTGGISDMVSTNQLTSNLFLIIVGILCCMPISTYIKKYCNYLMDTKSRIPALLVNITKIIISYLLLHLSTILLIGESIQSFFYFRF
ncbi:MAG: MBOAT family protein [Ruminococcaceae bacterium]|nr:MBOAT family protein [Oscillospiraceae bacterium]